MKHRKTLPTFLFVLILSLMALPISASTPATLAQGAQTTTPLFAPAAQPDGMAPVAATTIRARFATVDFRQVLTSKTKSLTLNLFEDATYEAVQTGSANPGPDRVVWQGTIKGVPDSQVTLAFNGQAMAGTVSLPGALYQISNTGRGVHAVEQVQTSDPMPEAQPIAVAPPRMSEPDAAPLADDGSVVDVMVLYTPAVRARYGQAGIQARIDLAVAEANQAYANSQVAMQLRLVYSAEVAYTEATSMEIDLNRLSGKTDGFMDVVHALRNTYRADTVTLIESGYEYCGMAYQMSALSPAFESSAFSVVAGLCVTGYLSFAHELGHITGLQHDRANALLTPIDPDAYGAWAPNESFRTVMAYNCPNGCQRVQHFSNPNVLYLGLPTGISYEVDPANAANNAHALNNARLTVANWRDSTAPPAEVIHVSAASNGSAGAISFGDEDIVAYDTTTHAWSMVFDGSDVDTSGDVDAFSLLADGSLLLSFDGPFELSPLGTVDDSDILRFVPTSLGDTTAGQFSWYFDGSDVGLDTNEEDVDALGFTPDGKMVVSVVGAPWEVTDASGAALSGDDVDLLAFTPVQLGETTSGTWALYFDGADVELTPKKSEDLNGVWIDPVTNKIYLSTLGNFTVTGASGDGNDVFICTPGSLGVTTTCTYGPGVYWDGAANGFGSNLVVDALQIVRS